MGYHDLAPEAFIFSVAVQETNTAEDAALFENWLKGCKERVKALSNDKAHKVNSDIAISTSISESISGNS